MLLAQQMGSGVMGASSHHTSKSTLTISDPIPGAKPLPVPPELAALMGTQQTVSGIEKPPVSEASNKCPV